MLLSITPLPHDLLLGLWKIEPNDGLSARENERRAVASLLSAMLGTDAPTLEHAESGKPMLKGWQISVSHTKGYAALLLSRTHEVGIDIEYKSDRVSRIVSRFLRDDETPQDVAGQLVYWSAKETLYKLYSEDQLAFHDMRLAPIEQPHEPLGEKSANHLLGENLKRGESTCIYFETNDRYTLTYAWR